MTEPNTLEELRGIVCSNSRMKFVTKVLYLLKFTNRFPEYVDLIGAKWCADQKHFLTNAKAIGNFLDLKPNSINTNFRDHGFQIAQCSQRELKEHYSGITNLREWKKRHSRDRPFNQNISYEDADQIPLCTPEIPAVVEPVAEDEIISVFRPSIRLPPKPNTEFVNSLFPPETQKLFEGKDSTKQQTSISKILLDLPMSDQEQKKLLTHVTNLWTNAVGNNLVVSMDLAKEKFIPALPAFSKSEVYQMRANFAFLAKSDSGSSQLENADVCKTISFDQFLSIYFRYGSASGIFDTLHEVSLFDPTNSITSGIEINESCYTPRFLPGFAPQIHKREACTLVNSYSYLDNPWVVIHSKQANRFTLYMKTPNCSVPSFVYIVYNALPAVANQRLEVEFSTDRRFGNSWSDLLFQVLNLLRENGIGAQAEVRAVEATADAFDHPTENSVTGFTPTNSQFTPIHSQCMNDFTFDMWSQSQTMRDNA